MFPALNFKKKIKSHKVLLFILLLLISVGFFSWHHRKVKEIREFQKQVLASINQDNMEELERLLKNQQQWVNSEIFDGYPFVTVCKSLPQLKLFVHYGADLSSKDKNGRPPIFQWCYLGEIPMVKYALQNGANLTAITDDGLTVWHSSAQGKKPEMISFLAGKVPELINFADEYGITPLHVACLRDLSEHTRLLVKYGADVNAQDKYGETPLHRAVRREAMKITKVLLSSGKCDLDIKDSHGNTAFDIAKQKKSRSIIKLFESATGKRPE